MVHFSRSFDASSGVLRADERLHNGRAALDPCLLDCTSKGSLRNFKAKIVVDAETFEGLAGRGRPHNIAKGQAQDTAMYSTHFSLFETNNTTMFAHTESVDTFFVWQHSSPSCSVRHHLVACFAAKNERVEKKERKNAKERLELYLVRMIFTGDFGHWH